MACLGRECPFYDQRPHGLAALLSFGPRECYGEDQDSCAGYDRQQRMQDRQADHGVHFDNEGRYLEEYDSTEDGRI